MIICRLAKHIEETCEPQFAQLTSTGQPVHLLFSDLLKQITTIRSNRSTVSFFVRSIVFLLLLILNYFKLFLIQFFFEKNLKFMVFDI